MAPLGHEPDWIADLASGDNAAVTELHRLVRRKLGVVLGPRGNVSAADLDDFTQDACLRILASLDSFRGDARFSTWATAVAIRVALTELRKRRWSVERTSAQLAQFDGPLVDAALVEPDKAGQGVERNELFAALRHAIDTELTERQRHVVLGELAGIPLTRLAERLDTKPNAVYKVGHDARKKLRTALERSGFDATGVGTLLDTASTPMRGDRKR